MPIYVYKCPQCLKEREVIKLNPMDLFHGEMCDTCTWTLSTGRVIPQPMDRVPTAASFSITGFSAKNGYSK